ncbi:MAG: hemerythrin domain-containing protein, partial [Rhodospirillales bacterium]
MQYTIPSGFLIGVESIDEEHQAILTEISEVKKSADVSDPAGVRTALSRVARMLKDHFSNEEAFMSEIGFPETESHAVEHDELLKRVEAAQDLHPPDFVTQIHSILDVVFQDMGRSDIY